MMQMPVILYICLAFIIKQTVAQTELEADTTTIHEEVKYMKYIIEQHNAIHTELAKQIKWQNDKILNLENKINHQDQRIDDLERTNYKLRSDVKQCSGISLRNIPDDQYQQSALGCLNDVIELSCTDNRTINITSATYGQYYDICNIDCCAPNPLLDCDMLVNEASPDDWMSLLEMCQNETECSFQYTGAVIDDCEMGYVVDYMHIYYNCLPESDNAAVGFSAFSTRNSAYSLGEVVLWDGLISNIGNHYNALTSSFNCPYKGVYVFNLHFKADPSNVMCVEIRRDDEELIEAWADDVAGAFTQGSAVVVAECAPGQVIWTRSCGIGRMYGGDHRRSHFTGYMLSRE